ncbi:hypothetical protein NLX71_23890 [Paenibacillus sp. MZ04-78.2]|uniref:DUF5724 domain-containing protein n=1 Tax=Paenibacillus sp. MZ04-78.2 TaxID=2962034 RepID=UPI0020B78B00|nr:hypothetical protein [Paenibacillus sp. MZ04-78.2]MCP3776303.1 hypothetical protein [Paenibacillus sp. MZ04-78.2]
MQAFEDGIYKVLINDTVVEELQAPLTIAPGSVFTYYRKGYRSRNLAHYMEAIRLTVKYYYNALAYECTLQDYLTRHDIILSEDSIMGDRIARELDMGNETVFEALRDIMFGENQTALLTRPMIRGIVQSHNVEAYEMLGRLLPLLFI